MISDPDHIRAYPAHHLARAMHDAARWHGGQVRKDGSAYLSHLLAVAADVARDGDPVLIVLALLHDLVEDHGDELPDRYIEDTYGEEIAALLDALSHVPGERRDDYIDRVIDAGPLTRRVKLADLTHNYLDLEEADIPAADVLRLRGKYVREIERLSPLVQADRHPALAVVTS